MYIRPLLVCVGVCKQERLDFLCCVCVCVCVCVRVCVRVRVRGVCIMPAAGTGGRRRWWSCDRSSTHRHGIVAR
jgi:hypothetical protein